MLEDIEKLDKLANKFRPDVIIHLAAQAGVRYSLENPRSYVNSNIIGTFNVMEIAKKYKVKHLLIASTSSVYGSNSKIPFKEIEKADAQLTIYAATKKAVKVWHTPTLIYGKYQLQCYVFSQFMDLGVDLIWLYINLFLQYSKKNRLIFIIMEKCIEILRT